MNTTLFVNREEELKFIKEYILSSKNGFIPIYGRRRVGKTTLIKKALERESFIYLLSKKTSIKDNLINFEGLIQKFLNLDLKFNFENFEDIFKYLKSMDREFIIVIDEFSYLTDLDSGISSIFQYILDEITKNSKIKLFLLGSSISMMERDVLSAKSPLYGRRVGNIKLKSLKFKYLKYFFKNMDVEDLIQIYAIFGGIPYYLENIHGKNLSEIFKNVFNKNNIFYNEVEFLLKEELKDPRNYKLILQSIAYGNNKFSDILSNSGIERSVLNYYLGVLENLEFIKKEIPYLESIKTKKTNYSLNDEFISFWFKFINNYQDKIELEDFEFLVEFKKEFQNYLGFIFEKVVCEYLFETKRVLYKRQWGSYLGENRRNNSYEIDLMYLDKQKLSLCEVKFKELNYNQLVFVFNSLKEKIKYLGINLDDLKIEIILFAKKINVSEKDLIEFQKVNNCICCDLEDMEKVFM